MKVTFGRVDFDSSRSTWVISGLPGHVSMRFKSVFSSVPIGSVPPFEIRDKADVPTDLEWFLSRYPMEVSDEAAARIATGVVSWRDNAARLAMLRDHANRPMAVTGFRGGFAARPHQARAAEIARTTGSLLLLDEVGLGKTVSALAMLSDGWGLPAAVVVQPHISTQWVKRYIERFTHLRAIEVKDRNFRDLPDADVYVFRYSNIAAWVDAVRPMGIRTVIFDEIQELRHGEATEKGRAARSFCDQVENRIGLSATPIYNYGSEMFNVVSFIRPGILGSWSEFTTNWCSMSGTHWLVREPSALGSYLQDEGVTLRRTEDDPEVALSIPPLERQVVEVEWNGGDVKDQKELQRRLALRVISGGYFEKGQAARELDALVRQETGIAKARSVAAYARTIAEAGESVLIGGWHREVYRIWEEEMADLRPIKYTGTESVRRKDDAINAIIRGESSVLLMSNRSGAGVDGLQEAMSQAVIGELDWAPPVHTQFIGRLRRDGQKRAVSAHYLHVNGGSDPVVLSALGLKSAQSRGIIDPYGGGIEPTPQDSRRMRQLALRVLGRSEDEVSAAV